MAHYRGHTPHAFAHSPPRERYERPERRAPSSRGSPPHPPSRGASPPSPTFSLEDPQSPITPLWAMGSFVTSSSCARSPVSVTSSCPFDWSAPSAFPFPPIQETSESPHSPRSPHAHSRHRREHASTDLDLDEELLDALEHKPKPKPASQSLDMTRVPPHRRTKSHSSKRSKGSSKGSEEVFPRPRRPSTASVSTTHDELASMADAAEMALRRRTRSHLDSLQSAILPPVLDSHRRSASLGGERLKFAQQTVAAARPRTSPKPSPTPLSPAFSADERLASASRTLRSRARSPPPPMLAGTPPPPLPATRIPPPTRPPPPVPPALSAEEMRKEAMLAIREAESWDWPIPPPMAGRRRPKLYTVTDVTPRITSMDFASPFDSLASDSSKLLGGFSWDADSRRSSDDELPRRTNSSALSSELGPLTPDEVPHDVDPFERLTASVGHTVTAKHPPPPTPYRPPLRNRSTPMLSSSRFGTPF